MPHLLPAIPSELLTFPTFKPTFSSVVTSRLFAHLTSTTLFAATVQAAEIFFTSVRLIQDNTAQLTLDIPTTQPVEFSIDASSNLRTWDAIRLFSLPALESSSSPRPPLIVNDQAPTPHQARFYRVSPTVHLGDALDHPTSNGEQTLPSPGSASSILTTTATSPVRS